MSLVQKRLQWQRLARQTRETKVRIAVLAGFTANPVAPYLGLALEDAGLPAEIWVGPYNQIVQECLSDESETAAWAPHVLICWPRLEELWGERPLPLTDDPAGYGRDAVELAEICLDAARRWRATLLFVLPAIPEARPLGLGDANLTTGVVATATAVREALRRRLAGRRGVLLVDLEEAIRTLGSRAAYNDRLLALARIPFSEELFDAIGERMARTIRLLHQPARKVIVVDGDNTLWGGVVGEEGPHGVNLSPNGPGAAFRSFQAFLLDLRRAGTLLALCSKNDEADVWEVFARREMRLKRDHLAAWRIGWQPKSEVLRELAHELNVGLDSLIFIDDSAAEIAEVQAALPEVACVRVPEDPTLWLQAIQQAACFDRLPPTTEDLQRADYYKQEQRRQTAIQQAVSKAEYLAQLDVRIRIFEPAPSDLPRLSRLVAKTNQLNLNCRRRSEAELADLCNDPRYLVRLAHVTDRYGDYGVVGLYIARLDETTAEIDTFLLSCRAMGRGCEEALIADLFAELERREQTAVVATVEECPRNQPARKLFAELGCATCGMPARLRRIEWPSYVTRV